MTDSPALRPYRVLMVCSHNRARSVMASALLRWYLPPGFTVASAGFGPEGKPAITEVVELFGDAQLVVDGGAHALHLEAVAQCGVEHFDVSDGAVHRGALSE